MTLIRNLFLLALLIGYFAYMATGDYLNLKSDHDHIYAIHQRCPGTCNKKYCKIFSSCRPYNRTSKLKRLDVYINEGVKMEAPINLEVTTYRKFRTEYRPSMFRFKDDFCKMLEMKNHFIFDFFGFNRTRGNLFEPCPMSGHRFEPPKYTDTWVGTLVPTGEWRIDFILSKVINGIEEHLLTYQLYILVKARDAIGAEEF